MEHCTLPGCKSTRDSFFLDWVKIVLFCLGNGGFVELWRVSEWIFQVVHARKTILSLEVNWTNSFWHQGWDELNLNLRLFTCVSVLYITRLRLPNSIAAKSASVSFLLWKFNGANFFSNFWAFFYRHNVSQEKSITIADVVLKAVCLNVTVQRNNKRKTIRLSDVIQNY